MDCVNFICIMHNAWYLRRDYLDFFPFSSSELPEMLYYFVSLVSPFIILKSKACSFAVWITIAPFISVDKANIHIHFWMIFFHEYVCNENIPSIMKNTFIQHLFFATIIMNPCWIVCSFHRVSFVELISKIPWF